MENFCRIEFTGPSLLQNNSNIGHREVLRLRRWSVYIYIYIYNRALIRRCLTQSAEKPDLNTLTHVLTYAQRREFHRRTPFLGCIRLSDRYSLSEYMVGPHSPVWSAHYIITESLFHLLKRILFSSFTLLILWDPSKKSRIVASVPLRLVSANRQGNPNSAWSYQTQFNERSATVEANSTWWKYGLKTGVQCCV